MNFYLYSIIAFTVSAMLYYPRARNLGKTYVKNISTPNLTGGDILTLMLKEAKCENVKIRVYKKPRMEKQKKSLLSEKYNQGTINWQSLTIPYNKKDNIIRELASIGIDEQKLFPELEVFAKKFNKN